jgi:hypothetical protein
MVSVKEDANTAGEADQYMTNGATIEEEPSNNNK